MNTFLTNPVVEVRSRLRLSRKFAKQTIELSLPGRNKMYERIGRVPPNEIKNLEREAASRETEKSDFRRIIEYVNGRIDELKRERENNQDIYQIYRTHSQNLIKNSALIFALLAGRPVQAQEAAAFTAEPQENRNEEVQSKSEYIPADVEHFKMHTEQIKEEDQTPDIKAEQTEEKSVILESAPTEQNSKPSTDDFEEGASIETLKQRLHSGGEVDIKKLEPSDPGLNEMLTRGPITEHIQTPPAPPKEKSPGVTPPQPEKEHSVKKVSAWSKIKNSFMRLFRKK